MSAAVTDDHVYDCVGIGAGPFNLGLAALAEPTELDAVFLEARDSVSWHPGLLLEEATLQVPFLADLVTLADPTSPYSFLAYLKETGRLYPFYVRESFYPLRREYDAYLRWAADRLDSVRCGQRVTAVTHDGETYCATTATGETFRGRRLVLGVGTRPWVPPALRELPAGESPVVHAADFLTEKDRLQQQDSITVVGSGQSAAEVYAALLDEQPAHGYSLTWVTRSPRFFPLEYTKLTLEMTSPEWSRHFQRLDPATRERLLPQQKPLSKGISAGTVDAIHDRLYTRSVDGASPDTTLLTATEVTGASPDPDGVRLALHHTEQREDFALRTGAVVLATGYAAEVPAFLEPVRHRLRLDERGRFDAAEHFTVDHDDQEVFVQNAEEHTHGFVAPDLGMGAMRSSVILARLLGREAYPVEKRVAFQEFGVPDRLREVSA